MSHQYAMGVSTQYQNDAHSMYQCSQESWSMPGVGVSHHCPPAQTLVEMGSGMSAVGQLLPLLQDFPTPWRTGETSSPGTRTLKDLSAPAGLCLPAPADCSHNQSRDPSHCAHHDQPCGGDTGVSRSCAAPTLHCPEQCRTSVATASLCFPGEGVRPPTSVLQALPSTTSSFEGMGDASTGYFVAAVLVEVERVAAALLPAGPLRRSSSLNLLGTRCLPVVAGVAMGQSWV